MFPIVLRLDELNSYLKMCVFFNALFLVAANTWVQNSRQKGTPLFWEYLRADGTRSIFIHSVSINVQRRAVCREQKKLLLSRLTLEEENGRFMAKTI